MQHLPKHFYEFASFQLDPVERRLQRNGEVFQLTPKAFDVLLMLVENSGHALKKQELIEKVWNGSFVEEKNLADNISALRKILGDDPRHPAFIETVSRHGYRFVADVQEVHENGQDVLVADRSRTHIVIDEPGARTLRPKQKRRRALIAVAAAILVAVATFGLLIGAAGLAWKLLQPQPPATLRTRTPSITLVTNSGVDVASTISPDGKFIAYVQNFNAGTGSLYVRQTGNNNEIALLPPGERMFGTIAFAPDSSRIYFITYDASDPGGALYEIPVLGGPAKRLLPMQKMFGLAPDGKRVAFFRDDGDKRHLMTANLDGSAQRTLLSRDAPLLGGCPAWSPDGKQIAVLANDKGDAARNKIVGVDLASGESDQLTPAEWIEVGKMVWQRDALFFVGNQPRTGQQLFYLSFPDRQLHQITSGLNRYGNYGLGVSADGKILVGDAYSTSSQVWSLGSDGDVADAVRLTTGADDGGVGLTTLPDGRIVYVARVNGLRDIWIINSDGSDARPLTASEQSESDVAATPDGRYIVFAAELSGKSHLYRLEIGEGQVQQLTSGAGFDDAPDCSADSQWVVYTSTLGGRTFIRRVPIDGGQPLDLVAGAVAPAFSPDSTLVSCIFPSGNVGRPSRLALVPLTGGPPFKTFDVVSFSWWYTKAQWTPDGKALVYRRTEAKKGGLWNLWQQPISGGDPKRLTNFETETIFRYAFTHDGNRMIVSRGSYANDVALIRDFR